MGRGSVCYQRVLNPDSTAHSHYEAKRLAFPWPRNHMFFCCSRFEKLPLPLGLIREGACSLGELFLPCGASRLESCGGNGFLNGRLAFSICNGEPNESDAYTSHGYPLSDEHKMQCNEEVEATCCASLVSMSHATSFIWLGHSARCK